MNWIEALVLGIIQGLTEFLPVSSSGHLELGEALLGLNIMHDNLVFNIVVHTGTVCSTIVVFRRDIANLFSGLVKIEWNHETQYISKLLLSAVPVVLAGLFLEDQVESLFSGNLIFVGSMLMVTALLLAFTFYAKQKEKSISFGNAFIIGIAQAIAVMPGLSRSGSTISTALLLNNKRDEAARFSFLMVLIPILGKVSLDIMSGKITSGSIDILPLIVAFVGSFFVGLLACKLMIAIVKKSKLIYFAMYCAVVGILTVIISIN